MAEVVIAWYAWLSGLTQGPILVIQDWIEGSSVPLVSALLFGLIGATSPCQLTTNLGALAFSASRAGTARVLGSSLAYVAGKVLVYSVVGGLAVVLGLQLQGASIPVVLVARKLLGPLMLLVGLGLLGLIRLPGGFGLDLSRRLVTVARDLDIELDLDRYAVQEFHLDPADRVALQAHGMDLVLQPGEGVAAILRGAGKR